MKIPVFLLLLFFSCGLVFSSPKIEPLSSFRIWENIEIRQNPDFSSEPKYRTLNHEGGLNVKTLKIGKNDSFNNQKGKWIYVLLESSIWVESGDWLEKYSKFWIFLPDDAKLFDYEE